MPQGRPTTFTQEIADAICTELASGKSLRSICKPDDMPHESTVRQWAIQKPDFYTQYAAARDIAVDCMADEILDIADYSAEDLIKTENGERVNSEVVARSRLRVDTRKWYLSKLAPKKYGDALKLSGDAESPLQVQHALKPEDKDIIERFMKERT